MFPASVELSRGMKSQPYDSVRVSVIRLVRRYESLFGFAVIDHTRPRQPDGAPNRSQPVCSDTSQTSLAAGTGG